MHEAPSLVDILLQSGIVVKIVLLLLLSFSIYSWAIILQKRKFLKKVRDENNLFYESYNNTSQLVDIYKKSDELPLSSYASMFKQGYLEINQVKEKFAENGGSIYGYFQENGFSSIERSLSLGGAKSIKRMEEKLSILASVSSVCPFIGLFGTVWGIIDSFTGLALGGGSIEAVAPGIAEALVATAIGLFAAIPANWFFNNFSNEISRIRDDMESFGQDFLNTVSRNFLIRKK